MRQYRGSFLSARPGFLLRADFSYDHLLWGPDGFAGSPREGIWMCFPKY